MCIIIRPMYYPLSFAHSEVVRQNCVRFFICSFAYSLKTIELQRSNPRIVVGETLLTPGLG